MDPELLQFLTQLMASKDDGSVNPNGLQDIFQMLADPMLSGASGGGFAPGAFEDDFDGYDEFDLPDDPFAPYTALGQDSYEAAVAAGIQAGGSPSQVAAQAAAQFELEDDALKNAQKLASDLFTSKSKFESEMAKIPQDAEIANGKARIAKYKPSEAAQAFHDAGLPLPTERYTPDSFADASWTANEFADSKAQSDQSFDKVSDLRSQLEQMLAQQSSNADMNTTSAPGARAPGAPAPVTQGGLGGSSYVPDPQLMLDQLLAGEGGNLYNNINDNFKPFPLIADQVKGLAGAFSNPFSDDHKSLEDLMAVGQRQAATTPFGGGELTQDLAQGFDPSALGQPTSQGVGTNPVRQAQSTEMLDALRRKLAEATAARSGQVEDTNKSFLSAFRENKIGQGQLKQANARGETPLSRAQQQRAMLLAQLGM